MLLYVLPFVILLVIAILLKKREANKNSAAPQKQTVAQTKMRTTTSTDQATTSVTIPPPETATPLAPELRRHIEKQIQDGNYFAAEAQINQALNRNSSQHELYLILLDLHLSQNDDFAINQLFTHLRSLNLDELLFKAENKRILHEQDLIAKAQAKREAQAAKIAASSSSFEQLQQPIQKVAPIETPTTQTEQKNVQQQPLEFNTQFSTPNESPVKALDFQTTPPQENRAEPQALEFNTQFASTPTHPTQQDLSTTDTLAAPSTPITAAQAHAKNTLDFTFDLEKKPQPTIQPEIKTTSIRPTTDATQVPLEFSFNLEIAAEKEQKPILDAQPKPQENIPITTPIDPSDAEFSFDLPQKVSPASLTKPKIAQKIEFEFNVKKQPTAATNTKITPQPVPSTASKSTNTHSNITSTDPLLQLFPTLTHINDVEINIRLAEQYIQLGAYAEARSLLNEHAEKYTDQQRQTVENLLNKITS